VYTIFGSHYFLVGTTLSTTATIHQTVVAGRLRPESQEARLDGLKAGGEKALAVMEQQLKQSPYLCGDAPTIADIALYAYTHVAEEGIFSLFSLQGWPAIRSWIARIEAHPRHLTLPVACQAS
jgi:glutathione S-transferase